MLFDSHCHLTADAFDGDRDAVLERAREAGVDGLVTVASIPADALAGLRLAEERDWVWTTAGYHPHEASRAGRGWKGEVREMLQRERVVAVGECGLDYHYDNAPRDVQRRVLAGHVEIAAETGLPLIVHSRDADDDTAAVLRDLPPGVGGVVHCFTGSDALLDAALEAGFHVSFTGIVSFRGYGAVHQVARVPADRLMIETDAPYLAPVPHRGRRNEPSFVREVAAAVASHRGESVEDVARATTRTARRFYSLDGD